MVGQQLDSPVYPGQVLVRQMLAATPQLASGEQVVGTLLKGDQMPSVPLVAGDTVHVVAVPQAGQGSTIGGTIGKTLVPSATVFAVGPPPGNQTQYVASVSLEIPGIGGRRCHLLRRGRPDRPLPGQRGGPSDPHRSWPPSRARRA